MNGMIIRAGTYSGMEEPPKMPNFVLEEHMARQLEFIVKPMHDLSAADPFLEMTQLAMFEFGRCNL